MRRLFGLFIVLMVLIGLGSPIWAAPGNPIYTTIGDVYVFRNVINTGDQLYYVRYDVSYGTVPTEPASQTFLMAIYDTDGTTLKYTRGLNYYQHNIISIYLTQAQALPWLGTYWVKIMGNPAYFPLLTEGINKATRQLGPGDYREHTDLGAIILTQAQIIETDWVTPAILTASGLLNTTGATYFNKAIPGLSTMAPEIFSTTITYPSGNRTAYNFTYAQGLQAHQGATLNATISNITAIFTNSTSGSTIGWGSFWLISILYLMLAAPVYVATKDSGAAIILSFPLVMGMAWLGIGTDMLTSTLVIILIVGILFGIIFILGKFA